MLPVLLLNRSYQPVRITTVRRAIQLLYTGTAGVVDEEAAEGVVTEAGRGGEGAQATAARTVSPMSSSMCWTRPARASASLLR